MNFPVIPGPSEVRVRKMYHMKIHFTILTIATILAPSTIWAASGICVDEADDLAICYDDPGTWHECPASDMFRRCPGDPICYGNSKSQIPCVGKVVWATASCVDNSATASLKPDEACMAHGGVAARYLGH
jgi:hypothetical protein